MEMPNSDKGALVFSGGQDSTADLAWALDRFAAVETVGFRYGQRHAVELECRLNVIRVLDGKFPAWDEKLGEDHLIDLTFLGELRGPTMTQAAEIRMGADGLPPRHDQGDVGRTYG